MRVEIGDDSIAVKQDIVEASEDFECDYLVLGCKGQAHSFREIVESLTKKMIYLFCSVYICFVVSMFVKCYFMLGTVCTLNKKNETIIIHTSKHKKKNKHTHKTKKIEKKVVDALGSVPDYCVHHVKHCSVIVMKEQES